jgi:hypothetical protein
MYSRGEHKVRPYLRDRHRTPQSYVGADPCVSPKMVVKDASRMAVVALERQPFTALDTLEGADLAAVVNGVPGYDHGDK